MKLILLLATTLFSLSAMADLNCTKVSNGYDCTVGNTNPTMAVSALNQTYVVGSNSKTERLAAFVYENGQTPATDVGPYSRLFFHYSEGSEFSFVEMTFELGNLAFIRNPKRVQAGVYSMDVMFMPVRINGSFEDFNGVMTVNMINVAAKLNKIDKEWYIPNVNEYQLQVSLRKK